MKRSEATVRAQARLDAKTDQIFFRVPKGEGDLLRRFAAERDLTLAEFIRQACYHEAGQDLPE